jgi:hypothetical protein
VSVNLIDLGASGAAATALLGLASRTRPWADWPFGLFLVVETGRFGCYVGADFRARAQHPEAFLCGTPLCRAWEWILVEWIVAAVLALALWAFPRTRPVGTKIAIRIFPASVAVALMAGTALRYWPD